MDARSLGSRPVLALSWMGTGFDSGVLHTDEYHSLLELHVLMVAARFFTPDARTLKDHLEHADLSTRAWTVSGWSVHV